MKLAPLCCRPPRWSGILLRSKMGVDDQDCCSLLSSAMQSLISLHQSLCCVKSSKLAHLLHFLLDSCCSIVAIILSSSTLIFPVAIFFCILVFWSIPANVWHTGTLCVHRLMVPPTLASFRPVGVGWGFTPFHGPLGSLSLLLVKRVRCHNLYLVPSLCIGDWFVSIGF